MTAPHLPSCPAIGRSHFVRTIVMTLLFACFIFIPFFSSSYGAQHIVLYHVGEKDQEARVLLKKHLAGKGFVVFTYEGTDRIEKQVEIANKINRLRASLFMAVEFTFSDQENVIVAVSNAKKSEGQFLTIEEVPAVHVGRSREFALLVAERFKGKVLDLPLFPLLGIDMPGLFLRITCPKEKAGEVLSEVSESMQKYFTRGIKDEGKQ